jgi:hypothetical protein
MSPPPLLPTPRPVICRSQCDFGRGVPFRRAQIGIAGASTCRWNATPRDVLPHGVASVRCREIIKDRDAFGRPDRAQIIGPSGCGTRYVRVFLARYSERDRAGLRHRHDGAPRAAAPLGMICAGEHLSTGVEKLNQRVVITFLYFDQVSARGSQGEIGRSGSRSERRQGPRRERGVGQSVGAGRPC